MVKISFGIKRKAMPAGKILRQEYGDSKNFMTPTKLKTGKINKNVAYELSTGEGFGMGSKIYGVSVVSYNPKKGTTRRLYDISKAFSSKREAEEYISLLKHKFR